VVVVLDGGEYVLGDPVLALVDRVPVDAALGHGVDGVGDPDTSGRHVERLELLDAEGPVRDPDGAFTVSYRSNITPVSTSSSTSAAITPCRLASLRSALTSYGA
jgi:hypothetical protein